MAKHDRKGRTRDEDRFTNIPNHVLRHEAVRTLPPAAFKVMIYMASRCFGAKDNGHVIYGVRSGCLVKDLDTGKWFEAEIGLKRSATWAALTELQRRGLIVCTKDSTFDQKKLTREYRLTWIRTPDCEPTAEYRNYRKGENLKASPPRRTVDAPIVRQSGQSQRANALNRAAQSATPDYGDLHSPPGRTLCNQGIRMGSQQVIVGPSFSNIPEAMKAIASAIQAETSDYLIGGGR